MIIIGTAGHIDHGKSSLVRALTGTDPDRLPEEKARGMTIDLGFAFKSLPNGIEVGFVDVPGHERFVKTMIAGAGGIDMVLLVVAADDGWMPQTEEHLQIIRLLGIERGIVVLSKCDLADGDQVELRIAEIKEHVTNSPLANASVLPVSTTTGAGLDHLIAAIEKTGSSISRELANGYARLSADRCFIQTGIGTVVTGTLRDGSLSVGDSVTVWPSLATGKIKTLQSRGREVQMAEPGFRTAISLSGEGKDSLSRGAVITRRPNLKQFTKLSTIALLVDVLPTSPISIHERRVLQLLSGTAESTGEAHLLFENQLNPGEQGIIFVEPAEPVFALIGDPVIIRLETPMVTIGGGRVVARLESMPKRRDQAQYQFLKDVRECSLTNCVESAVRLSVACEARNVLPYSRWSDAAIQKEIDTLVRSEQCGVIQGFVYERESCLKILDSCEKELQTIFEREPHRDGVDPAQLVSIQSYSIASRSAIVSAGIVLQRLRPVGSLVALPSTQEELKGVVKQTYEQLLRDLKSNPFEPLSLSDLASQGKIMQQVIKISLDRGVTVKIGSQFLMLAEKWREITTFIAQHFSRESQLTITHLKNRFSFSRKFAVPILEETDRLLLTARQGDVRIAGAKLHEISAQ